MCTETSSKLAVRNQVSQSKRIARTDNSNFTGAFKVPAEFQKLIDTRLHQQDSILKVLRGRFPDTFVAKSARFARSTMTKAVNNNHGRRCERRRRKSCDLIVITQEMLPYIAAEPGLYKLAGDLVYTPVGGPFGGGIATAAITILSNDVTLDLCDHTLRQVDKSVSDVYGVQIGNGLLSLFDAAEPCQVFDNITIKNGTIRDFSAVAILAYNDVFDFGCEPASFKNLHFFNLNLLANGVSEGYNGSAITLHSGAVINEFIRTSDPVAFEGVLIEDVNANDNIGTIASISVYTFDGLVIRRTQSNNFTSIAANGFAYSLYGRNLKMYDIQGNAVQCEGFGQCGGLDCEQGQNIHIVKAQFNDAFGENSQIVCSNISYLQNAVFEDVEFNNARGGNGTIFVLGALASDFPLASTQGNGYQFTRCEFNGATVSDDNPGGFFYLVGGILTVTHSNMVFDQCRSCKIDSRNNPGFRSYGFFIGSDAQEPAFPSGAVHNLTFRDIVTSDIHSTRESIGLFLGSSTDNRSSRRSVQSDIVVQDAICERITSTSTTLPVAGIMEGRYDIDPEIVTQSTIMMNLMINGAKISGVRAGAGNPLSAGILLDAVINPILSNNQITGSDRGILLTGTDEIIPNAFQLANTVEDATTNIPLPIDIVGGLVVSTNIRGLGPFPATLTLNSLPVVSPITALGGLAGPPPYNVCAPLPEGSLTGTIGVMKWSEPSCAGSGARVNRMRAAGDIASIIVDTVEPHTFGGANTQVNVSIGPEGDALIDALENGPVEITIGFLPSGIQSFTNISRTPNSTVIIDASNVDSALDFILADDDLDTLGWQSGDRIVYDCNGGSPIGGLVCGETYFVIIYSPGFTERGLIEGNKVSNNLVSGIEDDRVPSTSSAFVGNVAFCNGEDGRHNYEINWSGEPNIAVGCLTHYPKPDSHVENVSIVCGPCRCPRKACRKNRN